MIVWDLIERTQKMKGKRHTTEERIRILRKAEGDPGATAEPDLARLEEAGTILVRLGRFPDAVRTAALAGQVRAGEERGSWDPVGPWGYAGGRVYATAMMCLALAGDE